MFDNLAKAGKSFLASVTKKDPAVINDIIGLAVGLIIIVCVVVIGAFIAYNISNATIIPNTSAYYVGGTLATWFPLIIVFIFLALLVVAATLALFVLMRLRSMGGQ
jgi:hypothetical protein